MNWLGSGTRRPRWLHCINDVASIPWMTQKDSLIEPTRIQISIHKVLRAGSISVLPTSGSEATVSLTPLAFSYAVS